MLNKYLKHVTCAQNICKFISHTLLRSDYDVLHRFGWNNCHDEIVVRQTKLVFSGLRLLHELTSRKGEHNTLRIDFESADHTLGFDAYNNFLVDGAQGYTAHLGTRNSSLHLGKKDEIALNALAV